MRFDRKAKLVRKLADDAPNTIPRPPKVTNDTSKKSVARAKSGENSAKESSTTPKLPNVPGASPASEENNDFSISGGKNNYDIWNRVDSYQGLVSVRRKI